MFYSNTLLIWFTKLSVLNCLICKHTHTPLHTHTHTHTHTHIYIYIYTHTYIHTYVHTHTNTQYIYTCVHIHIPKYVVYGTYVTIVLLKKFLLIFYIKWDLNFFIVFYADNFLPSISYTVRNTRGWASWPKHFPKYINKSLITIGKFLLLLTNYFNVQLDVFTVVLL